MFLGGSPVVACVAATLVRVRLDYLLFCPIKNLRSSFEAEVKMRLQLMMVLAKNNGMQTSGFQSLLLDVQSEIDESYYDNKAAAFNENIRSPDDKSEEGCSYEGSAHFTSRTGDKFQEIIANMLYRFPHSQLLLTRIAYVALEYLKIPYLGYEYMNRVRLYSPLPDLDFMLFGMQLKTERNILGAQANRDVVAFNRYENLRKLALKHDQISTQALLQFWEEVSKSNPSIDKIRSLASQIAFETNVAQNGYTELLKIWDQSPTTLRLYAGFLQGHNPESSAYFAASAIDIESTQNYYTMSSFKRTLFADYSAVLSISGDGRNIGEILEINNAVPKMFGLQRSNLVAKNVTALMPEPFKTLHDQILRRNLSRGWGSVIDQRRRVVCMHQNGYIFDAIIYVKAFVSRTKTLAYLGIVEAVNPDEIQFVVKNNGVVTATSHTSKMWFDIDIDIIDQGLIRMEHILPEWNTMREQLILNSNSNDLDGLHFTCNTKKGNTDLRLTMEVFSLINDIRADIVRIVPTLLDEAGQQKHFDKKHGDTKKSYVESTENNSVSTKSDENNSEQDIPGEVNKNRKRSLASTQQIQIRASDSTARVKKKNTLSIRRTKQAQSIMSSQSGHTASTDASFNSDSQEQEKKQHDHENLVLRWLRTCVLIALAFMCISSLSEITMSVLLQAKHTDLSLHIATSSRRSIDLSSIVLWVSELNLMSRRAIPFNFEREVQLRVDLSIAAENLHDRTLAELNVKGEWNDKLIKLYSIKDRLTTLMPLGKRFIYRILMDSIIRCINDALVVAQMPLDEISINNEKVAFLLANAMNPITKHIGEISLSEEIEARTYVTSIDSLKTTTTILSLLALMLLVLFALRPAVISVFQSKDKVFSILFDVPNQEARWLQQQCGNRLNILTSNTEGSLSTKTLKRALTRHSIESSIEKTARCVSMNSFSESAMETSVKQNKIEQNEKSCDMPSSKIKQRHKRSGNEKQQQLLIFGGKIGLMLLLYFGYFVLDNTFSRDFNEQRKPFPTTIFFAHEQQFLVRSSLFALRQFISNTLIMHPDHVHFATTSTNVFEQLDQIIAIMNGLLYGSKSLDLPGSLGSSDRQYALQFENICTTYMAFDCAEFADGINTSGLQAVLVEYVRIERQILELFVNSYDPDLAPDSVVTQHLVNETLNSAEMKQIVRMENDFLQPSLETFIQIELDNINSTQDEVTIFFTLSMCIYILINFYVFFSLAKPVLRSIAKEFAESRAMMRLVPSTMKDQLRCNRKNDDVKATHESLTYESTHSKSCRRMVITLMWIIIFVISIVAIVLIVSGLSGQIELMKKKLWLILASGAGAFISSSVAMDSDCLTYAALQNLSYLSSESYRDFSFLVEAIGGVIAVLISLISKQIVDFNLVLFASLSGVVGTAISMLSFTSLLSAGVMASLVSSSFLALAICLVLNQLTNKSQKSKQIYVGVEDFVDLFAFGFIGGVISSFAGTGMKTIVFALTSLYFRVDESIGMTTAIWVGTINAISGVCMRLWLFGGLDTDSIELTIAVMPVVALGAVLGSIYRSKQSSYCAVMFFLMAAAIKFGFIMLYTINQEAYLIFLSVVSFINWSSISVVIGVGGLIRASNQ